MSTPHLQTKLAALEREFESLRVLIATAGHVAANHGAVDFVGEILRVAKTDLKSAVRQGDAVFDEWQRAHRADKKGKQP